MDTNKIAPPNGFVVDEEINPPEGFQMDEPKSVMGAVKNLGSDIKNTVTGAGHMVSSLLQDPVGFTLPGALMKGAKFLTSGKTESPTLNMAKNIPGSLAEEGKRIGAGELLTGHPINAAEKFGNALYNKPLTTSLDVLPAIDGINSLRGAGKVARGSEIASESANVAEKVAPVVEDVTRVTSSAPSPLNLGDEAANILKKTPESPFPIPSRVEGAPAAVDVGNEAASILKQPSEIPPAASAPGIRETISGLKEKIPTAIKGPLDEVGDFLTQKYGKATKTPGVIENVGKALEQKGRGMRLKEIGGSPGQVRVLRDRFGETVVNDLADLADKKGITKGFFNFQTGNEIKNLTEKAGKNIGAIRDIATKRGAIHNSENLIQSIRAELDPIYMTGSGSSQKGPYLKALQDIRKSNADVTSIAKTISEKNRFLKKNKLTQPIGAGTDVFNTANRLNNDLIRKFLKPAEADLYKESLRDFSAAKVYDKMYGFTYGRDMAGRSGPSSILNFVKDIGARKIMEKVFSNVGKKMQANPSKYGNPLELTSDVLDSIDNALDEIIDQMGSGGNVPQ